MVGGGLVSMKYLRQKGTSYLKLSPLEKLSLLGEDGLGGLSYLPSEGISIDEWKGTMDDFFQESIDTIEGEGIHHLDEIFAHESSTGGSRPKAHIRLDNEEWIVKFRSRKILSGWEGWNTNTRLP